MSTQTVHLANSKITRSGPWAENLLTSHSALLSSGSGSICGADKQPTPEVHRYPDPGSIATDAFLQNGNKWPLFIYPPVVPGRGLPKKYSCNNFTECSVKVKIEAFKNKLNIYLNFICVKVYTKYILK